MATIATGGNQTVGTVVFFASVVLLVVPLLGGVTALKCPACRKRVKLGATACHHCGRAVAAARRGA